VRKPLEQVAEVLNCADMKQSTSSYIGFTQQLPASDDIDKWVGVVEEDDTCSRLARIQAYAFADQYLVPTFRCAITTT
jgi:hypothetical protein